MKFYSTIVLSLVFGSRNPTKGLPQKDVDLKNQVKQKLEVSDIKNSSTDSLPNISQH